MTLTRGPAEERVVTHLNGIGIDYELFRCDPELADTAQFCAAYGFSPDESANTIVVVTKSDPPRHIVCVVLATQRIDINHTVRQKLGARKVSFANPEDTIALTGMQIGGVTPFGLPKDLPVWIDHHVMERERIVLGGGSRSMKVIGSPELLRAISTSEVIEGLALQHGPI